MVLKNKKAVTKRVNFIFDERTLYELKKIQEMTESHTQSQAIRRAVHLSNIILEKVAAGEKINLVDKDGNFTEVLLLIRE